MEWHYATPSGRFGPIKIEKLQEMLTQGLIDTDTLVWKTGMPDWIPISKCNDLVLYSASPPPISETAMGNGYIWALSLAPIWGYILQIIATHTRVAITGESFVLYSQMWWIMILVNIGLLTLDIGRLKQSGYNTEKIQWWMYLLVPVYIFQRDKIVKSDMTRFWIWIGSFVLSLVIF